MASVKIKDQSVWTLVWRIENFSYWDSECHGEKIISPKSGSPYVFGCQCYLHLFRKGKEERDQHLRVQFQLIDLIQSVTVNLEVSFLDGNGSALTTGIIRNRKIENTIPFDLPDCPMQEEVFQSKGSSFLPHDTLTVQCRLWRSDSKHLIHRHLSARSRIDKREKSILFPPGLLRILQLDQKKIFYLSLRVMPSVKKIFNCIYSFTGSSLGNAQVNFQISTVNDDAPFLITCKLPLLNTERKTIKCKEDKHMFNRSTQLQNWHFPLSLSRQELLENNDIDSISTEIIAIASNISATIESSFFGVDVKSDVSSDDVTSISETCIQITQQKGDKTDSYQQRIDSATILGEDFLSIYKDQTLSDFQLVSGDFSFPVHKIVLSARSPVFRAMFCCDMREVDSTSLDVPDVDANTLNRMLTFLYSGTVDDLQWEGAAKLYYAADKYQILSLKQECSSFLRSGLSVSNVSDILELADRHQDQELTSFVHDFLMIHFDEIVISDEWDKFLEKNGYFAGKTMKEIYKKRFKSEKPMRSNRILARNQVRLDCSTGNKDLMLQVHSAIEMQGFE